MRFSYVQFKDNNVRLNGLFKRGAVPGENGVGNIWEHKQGVRIFMEGGDIIFVPFSNILYAKVAEA